MTHQDSGLRRLGFIVGSLVLWYVTYAGSILMLDREPPPTAGVRGVLVAVAVLGFLPWLFASASAIRAQDEFTQRVHLVALAGAFVGTALFVFASDFLQRAHFIGDVPLMRVWIVMVFSWAAAIVIASRYYR